MVYGYIVAGQEQKGLKLAEQLKRDPILYSLVTGAVSDAYKKIGQKDKGYNYLLKSIEPIDKRFKNFISDLQMAGKEKAFNEAEKVQKITPFYSYLFEVMKPYDSTYPQKSPDK